MSKNMVCNLVKRIGVKYCLSDTGYGLITVTARRFGRTLGVLEFNCETQTIDMFKITSHTEYGYGHGKRMLETLKKYLSSDLERTWSTIYVIPIPIDTDYIDKETLIAIYKAMGFAISEVKYDGRNDRYSLTLNR